MATEAYLTPFSTVLCLGAAQGVFLAVAIITAPAGDRKAKRLLAHTQQSVLSIALDAGFNSKTAFYTAFRKRCGTTPRRYRSERAPHVDQS
ncbi:MAG: helix-turn-helix domain-containing protein [Halioglobus sp.]|nr:helix-turn-helix domain-containing protein [Halioglobus sp.]